MCEYKLIKHEASRYSIFLIKYVFVLKQQSQRCTEERKKNKKIYVNLHGILRTEDDGFWLVTSMVNSPVFKRIPVLDGVVAVTWIP